MSRTLVSGATGRLLSWPSGNWECDILGRVACLMGTPHYYDRAQPGTFGAWAWKEFFELPENKDKKWLAASQAYDLDGPACKEFAEALINVTDEVIATIHPETRTFIGTPEELKEAVVWQGKQYRKLKKGYKCLG